MEEKNKKKWKYIILTTLLIVLCIIIIWWLDQYQKMDEYNNIETVKNNKENVNSNELGENDWFYINDQVKVVITPQENESTCEITWGDEATPGEITLYTIDENGEKRNLEVAITDTSCVISEDITDLEYVGVEIDTTDVGGLQPPDGGLSQMMYILPDNPTTVYPTSGQWNYNMTATADNLSCAAASGGFTASGPVSFTTSSHGMSAHLNADSASVHFYRPVYSNPHYESSSYGNVSWELDVIDQEHMTGFLHMEGEGCTGDYPITMDLDFPTVIPVYVPHQGTWMMDYGSLACGGTALELGTMSLPVGSSNLSITGGGPIPMMLLFSGWPNNLILNQSLDTNNYNSFPNMYLGTALEMVLLGNGVPVMMPFTVMGTFHVTAMSDSLMTGILLIQGSNGCTGASPVSFTSY